MAAKNVETAALGTANTPLDLLIDLFVVSRQIEGKSKKTTEWYRANLNKFAEFATNGHAPTLADLSLEQGRAFVAHLQGRTMRYEGHGSRPAEAGTLSPHTVHAYVRTLRAFGSWLLEEGYASSNIFQRLKPPKLPETMIEILSDDEIKRLLAAINPKCYLGARMYAIFLLLLDTGIRASELCGLTLGNVHFGECYMKVRGKGNKERIVPFGLATKKALLSYLHGYRQAVAEEGEQAVFLGVDGAPLRYAGLAQAVRRLGKSSGVARLHPHLFRHTFAVRYLMNGGDIMTLRLILGHTTLEVTQMYLHLAEAHVQVQHSKFSPVDRLDLGKRRK